MSRELKISLHNAQRDLPLSKVEIRRAIAFVLELLHVRTDEVIFHFVTDRALRQLHGAYFQDSSSTDCITFPLDSPEAPVGGSHILGEAFICPRTAIEYVRGKDPYEELYRYVVHCLLHLVGYEDTEPKKRAVMKRKEAFVLKKLLTYLRD